MEKEVNIVMLRRGSGWRRKMRWFEKSIFSHSLCMKLLMRVDVTCQAEKPRRIGGIHLACH